MIWSASVDYRMSTQHTKTHGNNFVGFVHQPMLFRMELMKNEMNFKVLPQTGTKHPLR